MQLLKDVAYQDARQGSATQVNRPESGKSGANLPACLPLPAAGLSRTVRRKFPAESDREARATSSCGGLQIAAPTFQAIATAQGTRERAAHGETPKCGRLFPAPCVQTAESAVCLLAVNKGIPQLQTGGSRSSPAVPGRDAPAITQNVRELRINRSKSIAG